MMMDALSSASQGMLQSSASLAQRAEAVTQPEGVTPQNVTGIVSDQASFEANAAVARVSDEMMGSLLDILA